MDEEIMRSCVDAEYLVAYESSLGYDLSDLNAFRITDAIREQELFRADPAVRVHEQWIPGPADHPQLKVRIYEPADRGDALLPCVLFFHAGGFIFGSAMRHEGLCIRYCKKVNCMVVSVDYRLAPEHKAPAAHEDAYAALLWVASEENGLRVDPKCIAVAGVSAGGNLAASVALMARDRKGPNIVLQMPLSAALDCRMCTPSAQNITSPKVWSSLYNPIAWRHYLEGAKAADQYISPSLAQDLTNLPPCFSYVGDLDPFLDENVDYWKRLKQAGVEVESNVIPGCYHCFELDVPPAKKSRYVYELSYAALRRAFEKTGAWS